MRWCGSLSHAVSAGLAGVFRAHCDNNAQLGRHNVQPFTAVFTDLVHDATATRADQALGFDDLFDARRKLHEVAQSGTAPIAEDGLKQIAALYRIEKDIRGLTAEERLDARKEQSAPLIATFETWLTAHRARVSAKAPLGEALKYITKYWDGLCLFLIDGRMRKCVASSPSESASLREAPIGRQPKSTSASHS